MKEGIYPENWGSLIEEHNDELYGEP